MSPAAPAVLPVRSGTSAFSAMPKSTGTHCSPSSTGSATPYSAATRFETGDRNYLIPHRRRARHWRRNRSIMRRRKMRGMQLAYAKAVERCCRRGFGPTRRHLSASDRTDRYGRRVTVCPVRRWRGTVRRLFTPRPAALHPGVTASSHGLVPLGTLQSRPYPPSPRGHFSHARTRPAAVPATHRRGRRVLRAVAEHRPCRRHSRRPPHRLHRGRRAHRRADAGKSFL